MDEIVSGIGEERRDRERIDLISTAHCIRKQSRGRVISFEPAIEVELVNVSENGFCIRTHELFRKDDFLIVNIRIEDEVYNGIRGKVIWSMKDGDAHQYGLLGENFSGKLSTHIMRLGASTERKI